MVVPFWGEGPATSAPASLAQRRRDWAILRAIGAHARTLRLAIVTEALLMGLAGAVGAAGVASALQAVVAWQVRLRTGVRLASTPPPALLLLVTHALAALWPARRLALLRCRAPFRTIKTKVVT